MSALQNTVLSEHRRSELQRVFDVDPREACRCLAILAGYRSDWEAALLWTPTDTGAARGLDIGTDLFHVCQKLEALASFRDSWAPALLLIQDDASFAKGLGITMGRRQVKERTRNQAGVSPEAPQFLLDVAATASMRIIQHIGLRTST
ncbi:hypothetical protein J1614_010742 [Plenodomus biglobosus]|nr:hypothetical protein J1614_010742 [Plenodomus biglobosus]